MYTVYNIFKSILSYLKVLKLIISLLKAIQNWSFIINKKNKKQKKHYSWTVPHPIEKIVERQILIPLTQKYMTSHKKDMGKYIFVCFETQNDLIFCSTDNIVVDSNLRLSTVSF